jgi:hypothetical protein
MLIYYQHKLLIVHLLETMDIITAFIVSKYIGIKYFKVPAVILGQGIPY